MRAFRWLAMSMLVAAGPVSAQANPQITDSAGVRVVVNPAPRSNPPAFRLSARPRVSIGQVEGAPEYQLFRAHQAFVLSDGGIVVANVARNSAAAKRGLQPGDRILAANGHEVAEPEALGREVLRGYDRGGVLLVVQRGRYAYNLSFPL